jgi:hypothetical protein
VRGVEAEERQLAGARGVVHHHLEHAARTQLHLAVGHRGLDLHRVAVARIAQRGDAGLVLIAQRQVQGQIDVA